MKLSQEMVQQFLDIVKLSKNMKKDIVVIKDEYLLGMDEAFATLGLINYDVEKYIFSKTGLEYAFYTTNINTFIKNASKGNIFDLEFDKFGITDPHSGISINNDLVARQKIESAFNRCNVNMYNGTKTISDNNIRECEEFENILKLKTADGARLYRFSKDYIMYLFTSLFPVNKSDNVLVTIYDNFDKYSYLVDFHILKKKMDIHEYIRFRKI